MTLKEAGLQAREWARLCERAAGYEATGLYTRADAIMETADEIYRRLTRAGYTAEDLLTRNET
jgi:predicted phosphoadenosine phosphosulfate sulfurtransferase